MILNASTYVTANDRIQFLKTQFLALSSWEDRYQLLIQIGKQHPHLPENLQTEEAKIQGCQSQVWIHANLGPQGQVHFQADSDALLVKGLVAILVFVYQDLTAQQILDVSLDFLKDLGFDAHLSPSRTNGLMAMVRQIRNFATAFMLLQKMKAGTSQS
jgi:cysteine desulfuration protein SufE